MDTISASTRNITAIRVLSTETGNNNMFSIKTIIDRMSVHNNPIMLVIVRYEQETIY